MKFLIVLLAVFAFASAGKITKLVSTRETRSVASNIVDIIEGLRDQMPCGFESMNIPPLAPLKIEHKQVSIDTEVASVNGEVDKLRVYGLNEFEVTDMKVNVITSKVTFGFAWKGITVKSLYDLQTVLKAYGITVNVKGAGSLNLSINDLVVSGVIKYSLGLVSSQIKLKEAKIVVTIGDVDSEIEGLLGQGFVNRKLNEIIEEMILLAVNDNQDVITNTLESAILTPVNNAVDGMSLADLIIAVGGGDGKEPTVCIPPVDED